MATDSDVRNRLSPCADARESLRVPAIRVPSVLQTGSTSAFRRVSPHTTPADRDSPSRHSCSSDTDSSERKMDQSSPKKCQSEECGSTCSCRPNQQLPEVRTEDKGHRTETVSNPKKPKLSFSVEAIMSSKPSSSSSQHQPRSRDSSFSSPTSERLETYSPATSEGGSSSRESDATSPSHFAQPNGKESGPAFSVDGLLRGAAPPPHGGVLPPHHPFFSAAGAPPEAGLHWPWLGAHPPAPSPLRE